MSTKPVLTTWKLARLKPHPAQALYFDRCTPAEDEALKRDLEANGQREPIQVLPNGTVLDGCRRAQLLAALGKTKAKVLVRHDLADATEAEILKLFLSFNGNRRQLSKLAQARVVLGMKEAEKGATTVARGRARRTMDEWGAVIGLTGRTLRRYASVLDAPVEVQRAFDAGHIPLVVAGRVARELPQERQDELASRIADCDPKKVRGIVGEYISHNGVRHDSARHAFEAMVKCLCHYLHDLKDREDEVEPRQIGFAKERLIRARDMLDGFIKRAAVIED